MIKLENKQTSLAIAGGSQKATYGELIVERIKKPVEGVDFVQMKRRLDVIGKIEASNGTIELTDAEYSEIRPDIIDRPWPVVDMELYQFLEDFDKAGGDK